jgi:hypothetical protein
MRPVCALAVVAFISGWAAASPPTQSPSALPPVYFNHVTIYVDPAVYTEIASATVLNELAGFNESTTQRDGGKWSYTAFYIRGLHTYLEFMKAGNYPTRSIGRAPAGDLSFCMWVDDRLKLPLVRDSLATRTHTDPKISINKIFIGGRDIAWFDSVSATDPADASDHARTYVMSLYPDYLRQRYRDLKPEEDGTTREKRSDLPYVPSRLLHDITRFTLTVNSLEEDQLLKELEAYGYTLRADGAKRIASGPEIEFVLIPSTGDSLRKFAIDLELNRPKSGQRLYRLGNGSELEFSGKKATWYLPAGWRP